MADVTTGFFYDIGGREIYEDRTRVETFTTAGGLDVHVAAVADGVGGENKGERAAQLGLDSLFEYLSRSPETDPTTLLQQASAYANAKVHAEYQKNQGASATLSVAMIVDGETLFIANIGDSRIYLVRNEKLTQLTMDHTFANIMVWQGKMSKESARANPRAEAIMRAMGPKKSIPVDVGFYVNTEDPKKAKVRGLKGLPLKEGDSILVCSDGLIKESPSGHPYTTDDEIIRALNTQEGQKAAQMLVSFAIGRDADDNVSVATLQLPDPERAMTIAQREAEAAAARRRQMMLAGGGVLTVILALLGVIFGLNRSNQGARDEAAAIASESTIAAISFEETRTQRDMSDAQATEFAQFEATAIALTQESFTPTPLPTATPTLVPIPVFESGDIGFSYVEGENIPVQERSAVLNNVPFFGIQIDESQGEDQSLYASFYAHSGSEVEFDFVASGRIRMFLSQGSDVYVDAGKYTGGIEMILQPDDDISVTFNQCVSLQYTVGTLVGNCYGGTCQVETRGQTAEFAVGEQVRVNTATFETNTQPIPAEQGQADREFILQTAFGVEDAQRCLDANFTPPTPTPEPTEPIVVPTFTPIPTNTPRPRPTATPNAAATNASLTQNAPTPLPPTSSRDSVVPDRLPSVASLLQTGGVLSSGALLGVFLMRGTSKRNDQIL